MRNKKVQILCTVLVVIFISITVYKNSLPDCRNKTKEFLDWNILRYKKIRLNEKLEKNIEIDKNNYYKINLLVVENQINNDLQPSNFFSEEFLNNYYDYYKKGYQYYSKKPQYADTYPVGFNLNLLFFAQSSPQYFNQNNSDYYDPSYKLKIEKIDGNGQNIMVDDLYRFEFDKECKILNIDSFGKGGLREGVKNSFNLE